MFTTYVVNQKKEHQHQQQQQNQETMDDDDDDNDADAAGGDDGANDADAAAADCHTFPLIIAAAAFEAAVIAARGIQSRGRKTPVNDALIHRLPLQLASA